MASRKRPLSPAAAAEATPGLGAQTEHARVLPKAELERYLEVIAAFKVRTSNGKGRHLSTREAIRCWKTMAGHTEGHVQGPKASSRRRRSTRI